jgi:ABC-type transport system substrate-binding protein
MVHGLLAFTKVWRIIRHAGKRFPRPERGGKEQIQGRTLMARTRIWALLIAGGLVGAGDATADTPVRGGILNFAVMAEPPNYDCHSNTTFGHLHPVAPHYSMLLKFDGKSYPNVVGDLAESWTVSADSLSYTFTLHKNMRFHDGTPLTSADVKASYERIIRPPPGIVSYSSRFRRQAPGCRTSLRSLRPTHRHAARKMFARATRATQQGMVNRRSD